MGDKIKMGKNYTPYTLGLDIGMASVGACCLAEQQILGLHVRTFNKAETAKEGESLNLIRRLSRGSRRRLHRRKHRLLRLARLFKRIGMITQASTESFLNNAASPWELRATGLDRVLTSNEWAAVIYHLVKHRGFQSNRKSEVKADEKAGQMLSGVKANHALMQEKGYRTIGEMVAKDETFIEAKRNKGGDYSHTFARDDLKAEMHLLFAHQREFSNPFAMPEMEDKVIELLMARKPTLSGAGLLKMLGHCTFEPKEFRAPKASYSAERFVWLTKLNNLRIESLGESRQLAPSERAELIQLPFSQAKLTYKQVRAKLGMAEHEKFVGLRYPRHDREGKDPEAATLFEAKSYHALRKAYESDDLKSDWQRDSQDPVRLNQLGYALSVFKDDRESTEWLTQQGFSAVIIEAVLEVSFSEFVRLSTKAIDKLLPFMEAGHRYDEAVQMAGYAHHSQLATGEKSKYLPKIAKEDIINPVVYRALNQARKLVNAIVKQYGSPMAVHIELARDLNKPFDERRKVEKEQKEYRDTKEKAVEEFNKLFGFNPRGTDLIKWRLYQEQNAQCAYSQEGFDLNRLFDAGYAEIDHAMPYSRSYDDSMNNKVLVKTLHNRNKGNRTPFEYLGGDESSVAWQKYVAWVESNKAYRHTKKQKLLKKHIHAEDEQAFRERNLTDTRYASKKFKELIENHLALHKTSTANRCVAVAGQLTSLLRARWGLLKVRKDGDLHHALDAAVVAAASHGMVKRMADYAKRKELAFVQSGFVDMETGEVANVDAYQAMQEHFPEPYPLFRNELLARLSSNPAETELFKAIPDQAPAPVTVSRAPLRRGLGQAHQDTIRSAKLLDQGLSSVKTAVTSLKMSDIPNILGYGDPREQGWIDALTQRMEPFAGEDKKNNSCAGAKAFGKDQPPLFKPSKAGKVAPQIKSVKLTATQKSGTPVRGGIANNGDMLRIDIFTKKGKFYAVPIYVADAVKSELPNLAAAPLKQEDEWEQLDDSFEFKFSLHPNDWVKVTFKGKETKEGYYTAFNRWTAAIDIWVHDRNPEKGKNGLFQGVGIKTAATLEKYHVDMLGNRYLAKPETRQPICLPKGKVQEV
jgi:CRISPR-associated endonuclease Csn1